MLPNIPRQSKPGMFGLYENWKREREKSVQWPMESWHMCRCSASIILRRAPRLILSIHSPSGATSAPFHQDVTVLQLDQLSQDFKALLSFPYINSKARPSDFTLEHYQNSTGVSLCWPLGPCAFQRALSTLPKRDSPTTWHHRMTAGLPSQHMPAGSTAQMQWPRTHGITHSSP